MAKAVIYGLPLVIAITLHEAAHGFVAWKLGDNTAKQLGRVTANPIPHIDLYGTIIIPGLLILSQAPFVFGYAKPVPVNFSQLRFPRRDMVLVAIAGPATNIVLAFISGIILSLGTKFTSDLFTSNMLIEMLVFSLQINVVLAVFNMIPLPPLDGGRVAVGLLPKKLGAMLSRLEVWGIVILLSVIFLIPFIFRQLGVDFNPLAVVIFPIVKTLLGWIALLVGL